MASEERPSLWKALGPGLLWAGTAIGVSHLVQSTRAGAGYGLGLLWLVVLANLLKYPAFEAGPRYTAATGLSLLEGYRRRGSWVVVLFLLLTFATMFTVLAAVTIVTAGMAAALVTDQLSAATWSALLLVVSAGLLSVGRFGVLETFMKVMMMVLTASTVLSVVLLLPQADWGSMGLTPYFPPLEAKNLIWVAALAGWMPSAIDTAVWSSLWSLEKQRAEGRKLPVPTVLLDFNVGYVGTAFLATLFVFLGAVVLFGSGQEIPSSGGAFAAMLVGVYTQALGEWARPLILIAAFSTMLSTTIAVSDGFPRALEGAFRRLQSVEQGPEERGPVYLGGLLVCGVVAWLIITQFAGSLKALVDLATALTGLTAPLLAALNLWVLRSEEVPEAYRPKGAFLAFHAVGIVFLVLLAGAYLVGRLGLIP